MPNLGRRSRSSAVIAADRNGRALNVFAGVQNLTNRRNVGGYIWNRAINAADVNEQQGIFPILGFDWRF